MEITGSVEADREERVDGATVVSRHFMSVLEAPTSTRRGSRTASEEGEQYRALLEAIGVAVYTTDAAGVITFYNRAAAELWGREPEVGKDEWCGSWKIYHLDGTTIMPHGECPMAICLKENRSVRGAEAIAERPDGSRVYFQPFPTPLRDDSGRLVGAINVLVDITERKRAEEELRDGESRLSVAMAAGQMGSWEWRMADNTVIWSEALERIHGLQPGTFDGTLEAFLADVHPDDRESVQETIAGSMETGEHEIEYRIIRPDGQLRWVLGKGRLMREADGTPARMVGVCMDISERKQAELGALRLGAIVESSDDAIVAKDLNGVINSWNSGAERIFGYTADEAIGQSIRLIIPAERQDEEDEVIQKVRNGDYVAHFETVRRRKDGTEVDISLSVSPIKAPSGEIVGASKIARDITERKRSEEALRANEERMRRNAETFSALVEQSPFGMYIVDSEFRIHQVNPAAQPAFRNVRPLIGRDFGEAIRIIWPEPFASEVVDLFRRTLETGEPYVAPSLTEQRADTEAVESYEWRIHRIRLPDGKYGVVCDFFDATRLREVEASLRESEEHLRHERDKLQRSMAVKDEFLGLVSHELRTPITTILGNALLLQRRADKLPEENKREVVRDVAVEADRLQRIIENLLLLTRVDVAEPVETEPLRLQPIIAQAVDAFQRRNPRRDVSVSADGEIPIVVGQPAFVALVLDNLISNADKYSPPETTTEILVHANGRDDVEVCVRDYGIGISGDEAAQVFTPFYRSPRVKDQAKGIGLGLAVCKRVMDAQGGEIRAVGRPEGGCDFIFSLKRYRTSEPDEHGTE